MTIVMVAKASSKVSIKVSICAVSKGTEHRLKIFAMSAKESGWVFNDSSVSNPALIRAGQSGSAI